MVISNGGAPDCRSERIDWPGSGIGSLSSSGDNSSVLSAGLVEPNLDVSLPMFSSMDVRDDVVMFNH